MKRIYLTLCAVLALSLAMTGCTRGSKADNVSPDNSVVAPENNVPEDVSPIDESTSDYEADWDGMVEDSGHNDNDIDNNQTTRDKNDTDTNRNDPDTDNAASSRAGRALDDAADGMRGAVRHAGDAIGNMAEGTMDAVDDMTGIDRGSAYQENDVLRVPNTDSAA